MQQSLFAAPRAWETFALPDADVKLLRGFCSHVEADQIFCALRDGVTWRHDKIVVYGKTHDLPRLQQWYGDVGLSYTWSGLTMTPEPWLPVLLQLKVRVEEEADAAFNTALVNRYRTGGDTVGWHSDDEIGLGPRPTIASLSFGAERDFVLRHNDGLHQATIPLAAGSLLVMSGNTQRNWKHSLPRRAKAGERINVTFRLMQPGA